jgi:alpha-beta hydrolase superfamily lysophospholipase
MPDDVETTSFRSGELDLYARLRHHADQAPVIVLLSGLGFHTFEYEPFAIQLAAAGFNALSFDYRGNGRSPGPRGRWTLGELTADCQSAIGFARQRYRGTIVLFGNSLGAMVAMLAGARDDRPSAVIAANPPAHAGDFMLTRPRRALFTLMKLTGPVVPLRLSVDHFIAYQQLIDDPSWVATMQRDPLIADARRLSAGTLRELLETWDGPHAARQLRKPLLVIQGQNDHLQPPQQSELVFAAANDPKQFQLVDTGHLPHLEASSMLTELLANWLSTIKQSS